ncbi:MAG TPA: hypothetical protein VJB08_02360 [Candidatus Nanoarchaeia archaeon]|nr:hypothetical protein [Candidatus Nanoarchaeia archaeon]
MPKRGRKVPRRAKRKRGAKRKGRATSKVRSTPRAISYENIPQISPNDILKEKADASTDQTEAQYKTLDGSPKGAAAKALKTPRKGLPLLKRILGDEFLAVSAIIIFGSFMKLGYGAIGAAVTLGIIAAFSFICGVAVKGYIQNRY